jgi:hypothetical protein
MIQVLGEKGERGQVSIALQERIYELEVEKFRGKLIREHAR